MSLQVRLVVSQAAILLALSGCQPRTENGQSPTAPRSEAIGPDETIRLVGTEPFWGGTISAGRLIYTTPENPSGESVGVQRFAGLNGLGFSGRLGQQPIDIVVTEAACSDGMSDRRYPFSIILQIGDEQRRGCGWTDRVPYSEAEPAE